MKLIRCALAGVLLAGAVVVAAPVEVPAEVKVKPGRLLRIEARGDSKVVRWINVHEDLDAIPSETGRWLIVTGPTPGRYKLAAYGSDKDGGPSEPVYVLVIVEGPPTPPVPPTPPTPPVPPTPPGPPAPIPVAGFRVLVVYETAEMSKMPASQYAILFSKQVRDYLNAKCVVGPDGSTKEWRMWDKDVAVDGESKTWQGAMSRPRTQIPWLIVSNGVGGFEGPLPATVAETMAILQKWGG